LRATKEHVDRLDMVVPGLSTDLIWRWVLGTGDLLHAKKDTIRARLTPGREKSATCGFEMQLRKKIGKEIKGEDLQKKT